MSVWDSDKLTGLEHNGIKYAAKKLYITVLAIMWRHNVIESQTLAYQNKFVKFQLL